MEFREIGKCRLFHFLSCVWEGLATLLMFFFNFILRRANLRNVHQTLLVGPAESFMQKMNLIKVCVARLLSLNSDDLYCSLYDILTLCCTETVYNSEIYIVVFLYDIDILYFLNCMYFSCGTGWI